MSGSDRSGGADPGERDRAGLCAVCAHAQIITSDRGSRFYFCRRSKTDPRFPRYPRLPVIACAGWDAGEPRPKPGDRFGSMD